MRNFLAICGLLMVLTMPVIVSAEEDLEQIYDVNNKALKMVNADAENAIFSTNTYAQGLFDDYKNLIDTHDFASEWIDNNLSTNKVIQQGEFYELTLKKPLKFTGAYVDMHGTYENLNFILEFYDEQGELIVKRSVAYGVTNKNPYIIFDVNNAKNIRVSVEKFGSYFYKTVAEIDFFVDPASIYASVSDVAFNNVTDKAATVTWKNPNDPELIGNEIYIDDVLQPGSTKRTTHQLKDLAPNTKYKITVAAVYSNGVTIYKSETLLTKKDTTPPGQIKNLKLKQINNNVELTYDFPTDEDFEYVSIWRDGMLLTTQPYKENVLLDKATLKYNQIYQYRIIAYDKSGNPSTPVNGSIKLLSKDVTELKATATFDQVELNWVLPTAQSIEFVRIYRLNKDENKGFLRSLFSSGNEKQLFETNGTYFKDLTVTADTNYRYRVTSNYDNEETEGRTVDIKTPKVTATGGGTEIDGNGDYVVKWTKPTTGQMQIWVGGKLYKTVPAASLSLKIPKADMKFDLIGKPDIKLVPVDDNGNAGVPSTPGGGTNGGTGGIGDIVGGGAANAILNAPNLLKAGVALLGVIGGFVLLGLAFRVTPKLIRTIRTASEAKRGSY